MYSFEKSSIRGKPYLELIIDTEKIDKVNKETGATGIDEKENKKLKENLAKAGLNPIFKRRNARSQIKHPFVQYCEVCL
jgi:hypothetical protein